MKYLLSFHLLVICSMTYCQTGSIKGSLRQPETHMPFKYGLVELKQNSTTINYGRCDSAGNYLFEGIKPGIYSLFVSEIGYRPLKIDSICLLNDSSVTLNITYPAPCVANKGIKPACIGGHTNHIIPIKYGFPSEDMMRQAKKGKIHLGGCVKYGCDPRYYCTIHEKELY